MVDSVTCNNFTTWNSRVVLTHITRQSSRLTRYTFYSLPSLIIYPTFGIRYHFKPNTLPSQNTGNTGIYLIPYLANIPVILVFT